MRFHRLHLVALLVFGSACATEVASPDVAVLSAPLGQPLIAETEPNDIFRSATPIGSDAIVRAPLFASGDLDIYSFVAAEGDRVFAATMTAWSANLATDSLLTLLGADGMSELETDDDNGSITVTSSSIAGAPIPAAGTYYLVVNGFNEAQIRPYDLHFRLQSASPSAEVEPNNLPADAQLLPASGYVIGELSELTGVDIYAVELEAGDTVFASLDFDPERDATEWDGVLYFGMFDGVYVDADDSGGAGPDSEALFQTVTTAGTYYVAIGSSIGGFGTYALSVSISPGVQATPSCTTYTSASVPVATPEDPGAAVATIQVPGHPRVADLDVTLRLTHNNVPDLDVELTSPAGNTVALFNDIGAGLDTFDLTLDDEAAHPIDTFVPLQNVIVQPEANYRLSWFDGIDAGGTWTLTLRDDAAANAGLLTTFALTICEPLAPPACTATQSTVFSTDFEADVGGFTHSGTVDEWERGTPAFAPITTCNSGSQCWKTDLDGTYDASASSDLISPPIDLGAFDVGAAIRLSWAMKYQLESANFDHLSVSIRHVDDSRPRALFTFLDGTMNANVGNPALALQEAAGWALFTADVSDYAGSAVELVFHIDTDTSVHLAGVAIDDVSVTACATMCGNSRLDAAEDCDHGAGNGQAGDCCSAACTFVPDDTTCDDGDACTLTDSCQAGVCTGAGECEDPEAEDAGTEEAGPDAGTDAGGSAPDAGVVVDGGASGAGATGGGASGAGGRGGSGGSTRSDAAGEDAGAAGASSGRPSDDSDAGMSQSAPSSDEGCGCSVPGGPRSPSPALWSVIALGLAWWRRPRRRREGGGLLPGESGPAQRLS